MLSLGCSLTALAARRRGGAASPASLFAGGQPGYWPDGYDPAEGRLFQGNTTPTTSYDQAVGLALDVSRWGGKALAAVIALALELRGAGFVQTNGSPAQLATYDQSTGVGSAYRTNGTNSSGVRFYPLNPAATYCFDVENTGVVQNIQLRDNVSGSAFAILAAGERRKIYITGSASYAIDIGANNASGAFVLHALKEVSGQRAFQPTALSRPTLARWPRGGRRNLIRYSEDISSAAWPVDWGGGRTVTPLDEYVEGHRLYRVTSTAGSSGVGQELLVQAGVTYTFRAWLRYDDWVVVRLGTGNGEATYVQAVASVPPGGGWSTVTLTPGFSGLYALGFLSDSAYDITAVQIEVGTTPTVYQRVTTANHVTEADVTDVWHVHDDDDSLPVALPAGTYGLAYIDAAGAITVTTITDPADTLHAGRQVDVILRQGAFSAAEEALIRKYWSRYQ